jgi:hypothetical protein
MKALAMTGARTTGRCALPLHTQPRGFRVVVRSPILPFTMRRTILVGLAAMLLLPVAEAQNTYLFSDGKLDFRFYVDSLPGAYQYECMVTRVEIQPKGTDRVLWLIEVDSMQGFYCTQGEKLHAVELEDMNFDGYTDFRIQDGPSNRYTAYRYWLYLPERGQFVERVEMRDITSPWFNKEDSTVHDAWGDASYGMGHAYRFLHDSLTLMESHGWWRSGDDSVWVEGEVRSIRADIPELDFPMEVVEQHFTYMADDRLVRVHVLPTNFSTEECAMTKVEILPGHDAYPSQTFDLTGIPFLCPESESAPEPEHVIVEDMDFDGDMDFRIAFDPVWECLHYRCWLWDAPSKSYIQRADLEELSSPVFDATSHVVTSACGDAMATWETHYRWDGNGALIEFEHIENVEGENAPARRKTYAMKNGERVLVKEE